MVAPELLGKLLCEDDVVLRITEVEAYRHPDDSASHCRMGRTKRNAPMWGPAGHVYVYLCYGIHMMLNIVTDQPDEGAAVLIRACEIVEGHAVVAERRGGIIGPNSLAGPGKVGAALGLDVSWSGHPLFKKGALVLREGPAPARIACGARVGVDFAAPRDRRALYRFADADSLSVTHRKLLRPLARF